jgi:hypothetical protein
MEDGTISFGCKVRNDDLRGRKEGRKMRGISRIEGVWKEKGRLIWLRSICKAKTTL